MPQTAREIQQQAESPPSVEAPQTAELDQLSASSAFATKLLWPQVSCLHNRNLPCCCFTSIVLQESVKDVQPQAESSPTEAQTAKFSQLKADLKTAQEALKRAQLSESTLRTELELSRANQASARESLQQAEQSIDTLQHELSLLQHGETPPGSPDARSQQVGPKLVSWQNIMSSRKKEVDFLLDQRLCYDRANKSLTNP